MKSKKLIFLSTPLGPWTLLRGLLPVDEAKHPASEFSAWHDRVVGNGDSEAKTAWIAAQTLDSGISRQATHDARTLGAGANGADTWMAADARGCWTLDFWAQLDTEANFFAFYESPEEMLARWLTATDTLPPEQLLTIWTTAAQGILNVLRQNRHRVFLLGARESLNAPNLFRQFVEKRAGVRLDRARVQVKPEKQDALAASLARVWTQSNRPLRRLVEELQASSHPLGDSAQDAMAPGEIDPAAALLGLKSLRNDFEERARLFASRLEQAEKRAGELEKQCESASRQLDSLRKEYLETSRMLLLGLREAQKESEDYFSEFKRHERIHQVSASGTMTMSRIVRTRVNDLPPHKHVDFVLENVKLPFGQFPELVLRLVEHHHHAGLVIFMPKSGIPPVKFWKESGSENDVPFMLLCPHDTSARQTLAAAMSSDLIFLLDCAAFMEEELSGRLEVRNGPSHPPDPTWAWVAQNLQVQINELPERLHYDDVRVGLEKAQNEWTVKVRLAPASFRDVQFPVLEWRWLVVDNNGILNPRAGCLTFHAVCNKIDEALKPVLASWPSANSGFPLPQCSLDFDESTEWEEHAKGASAHPARPRFPGGHRRGNAQSPSPSPTGPPATRQKIPASRRTSLATKVAQVRGPDATKPGSSTNRVTPAQALSS